MQQNTTSGQVLWASCTQQRFCSLVHIETHHRYTIGVAARYRESIPSPRALERNAPPTELLIALWQLECIRFKYAHRTRRIHQSGLLESAGDSVRMQTSSSQLSVYQRVHYTTLTITRTLLQGAAYDKKLRTRKACIINMHETSILQLGAHQDALPLYYWHSCKVQELVDPLTSCIGDQRSTH